jgi:CheY-like chemotaxis protein
MPKIAIIDDDPDVLRLLTPVMAPHYEVTCFASGRAALEALLGEPPDIVLLDLELGDMSGVEVARAIRQHATLGGVPIIAMATELHASERAKLTGEGFTSFIDKPIVDPEPLVALVGLLVGAGESVHHGGRADGNAAGRFKELERAASVALDALDAGDLELARTTLRVALAESRHPLRRTS